jgi:hypothetical protein
MRNKWGQEVPNPPHYGGNKIPKRYLDEFNAKTDEWLRRIGARTGPASVDTTQLPMPLAAFIDGEL